MAKFLSEFEERMSSIPRWSLLRTIQKQSVMDHIARVAIMAPRIAREIWGWGFDTRQNDYAGLMRWALLHDQYEAFSGDMASMVKDCIDEDKIEMRYQHLAVEHFAPDADVKAIVKCADYAEACIFLARELSMGNTSVSNCYEYMLRRLENHMTENNKYGQPLIGEIEAFCYLQVSHADLRKKPVPSGFDDDIPF